MQNFKSILLKLAIILGLGIIILVSWSVYQEIEKKKSVQKEIENLQKEAEKISQENLDISQKISYLESQDYKEREAKEKLNLKSPDENVVIIKPSPSQKNPINESPEIEREKKEDISKEIELNNPEKWWKYFFSYKL